MGNPRPMGNPYPNPSKPVPMAWGTGLLGLGYGLAWETPGLPVSFPTPDILTVFLSWSVSLP
jgi:hypothetical protein